MIVDRYFYSRLPENEKQVYKEIYQGCMEHKDLIVISASREVISKSFERIVSALMDDNPLLYFVNQSRLDFAMDVNGNMAAMPQYFFSEENVNKYNKKIQDTANKLIMDLNLTDDSEQDKVKKVHDYICTNVEYDYGGSDINDVSRFITSHNIIGVFAHKKAQCEGIAKAAKVLLNAVDVKCIFISGKAKGKDGKLTDHGWNIVNIDGNPYHLDITFDIGAGSDGYVSYDYYNVSDSQIRKNHIFSTGFPKCSSHGAGYFETNDLVFSSRKKLKEHISDRIKAGDMMLYFKLAGKLRAGEIYQEMMEYGYEILCGMGKDKVQAYRTINEMMNICRIFFK